MASIHYGKIKRAGEVKAWLRHCDSAERVKREHRNRDIDKKRTCENVDLMGLSYEQAAEKYTKRIKELDESTNTNRRKDRVTCFGLIASMPEGLTKEQEVELGQHIVNLYREEYEEKNLLMAVMHYDEVHNYVSDYTFKSSRAHLHLFVVPEVGGVLRGKAFSSKANMKRFNREVDRFCVKKFGQHYMTGEKARGLSVERLKAEEAAARDLHELTEALVEGEKQKLEVLLNDRKVLEVVSEVLVGRSQKWQSAER